jgi:hypothetical protein
MLGDVAKKIHKMEASIVKQGKQMDRQWDLRSDEADV